MQPVGERDRSRGERRSDRLAHELSRLHSPFVEPLDEPSRRLDRLLATGVHDETDPFQYSLLIASASAIASATTRRSAPDRLASAGTRRAARKNSTFPADPSN